MSLILPFAVDISVEDVEFTVRSFQMAKVCLYQSSQVILVRLQCLKHRCCLIVYPAPRQYA